ncbi:glycosyltransferase family protein [Dyadobacter aurulentus]|uniref:glycosyltransferase n=1 Tax=Dyadobacter sp. UC 10 TaxID=2605428 RepID=UPI0011F25091|nr:glycosyltransferase [Dyadobacter sp. UC 10]KAA0990025.1 glycosyltransferase [Dyadobacter sp. UC 10]
MCKIFSKRLVITYHGNWGRYNRAGNVAVILSCRLAYIPIVQNEDSFKKAFRWNKNAKLISAYLSSRYIMPLDTEHMLRLLNFRKRYHIVVCTNAWNVTFDKHHQEIYGISALIAWIASQKNYGLAISDPSGNYARYIEQAHFPLPANVLFLSTPHDFRNVLKVSDAFIRNTTTDAISISICEALELNVPVLASDSVSRPDNCLVFSELSKVDLETEIAAGKELLRENPKGQCTQATIEELLTVYSVVLPQNRRKCSKKTKA